MPGETELLAKLAATELLLRQRLEKGWGAACAEVGKYAQEHHNYHNRTGATEASTQGGLLDHQEDPNKIVGIVTAGMPYDVYLETTTQNGGTPVGNGRYIREQFAFITPAMTAMHGEMLKICAEKGKE